MQLLVQLDLETVLSSTCLPSLCQQYQCVWTVCMA